MNRPLAIFINGPSSSGKSTLVKRLQKSLPRPFLHLGIDAMIELMPAHINDWDGGKAEEGYGWVSERDEKGNLLRHLEAGNFAQRIVDQSPEIAKSFLQLGFDVIVEEVCFQSGQFQKWQQALEPFLTLFVGVNSPVQVLVERERLRGDRTEGSARAQSITVHQGAEYHLLYSTPEQSIEECVDQILRAVQDLEGRGGSFKSLKPASWSLS